MNRRDYLAAMSGNIAYLIAGLGTRAEFKPVGVR